jgi:hypothetical protein
MQNFSVRLRYPLCIFNLLLQHTFAAVTKPEHLKELKDVMLKRSIVLRSVSQNCYCSVEDLCYDASILSTPLH